MHSARIALFCAFVLCVFAASGAHAHAAIDVNATAEESATVFSVLVGMAVESSYASVENLKTGMAEAAGAIRSTLSEVRASAQTALSSTRARLAAVASIPLFDAAASSVYQSFCKIFGRCEEQMPAVEATADLALRYPRLEIPTAEPFPSSQASPPPKRSDPFGSTAAPSSVVQQVASPVVERIVQRVVSGIGEATLTSRLDALRAELLMKISQLPASAPSQPTISLAGFAASQKIENLSNVTITNPTLSGGSVTTSSLSGTITNGIDSLSGTIADFITTQITATNAAITNATTTNATSTTLAVFRAPMAPAYTATSSSATSTFAGGLLAQRAPTLPHTFSSWVTGASNAYAYNAALVVNPASAVGDSNLISASVNDSVRFLVDAEGDVFANNLTSVGSVTLSTTTASTFTVEGNTTLGDSITDVTTVNGTLTVTGTTTASSIAGSFGAGTTSPSAKLSIHANNGETNLTLFAIGSSTASATTTLFSISNTGAISASGAFTSTASGANTFPYASSTALTVSSTGYFGTASSTSLRVSGTQTFENLASAGLAVNSSGAVYAAATTTFSSGLTYSNGNVTLDWLFPSNATTTGLGIYASSTIGAGGQATGLTISGGATTTGFLVVQGTSATSTFAAGLSATAIDTTGGSATSTMRGLRISSNGLTISTLASCDSLDTDASGNIVCGEDTGGAAFPFTTTTAFGGTVNATSTTLQLTAGLYASSTIRFGNAGLTQFFFNGSVGNVGIGTTSPFASLQIATSTGKNLVLSDPNASANNKHWLFSSIGGNLYIGTTTDAYATSSPAAISISNAGAVTFGADATTTFSSGINLTKGCFSINGACIGYTVKLTAIYSTSTPGSNVSVVLTGAQGSSPSFSAGTLTLPKNTSYMVVELWGGGGGGGGSYNPNTAGSSGGNSCLSTNATACNSTGTVATSTGGSGGSGGSPAGGAGGTGTGGDVNLSGEYGKNGGGNNNNPKYIGGSGGNAPRGGGGGRGGGNAENGVAGAAFGGGGGGSGGNAAQEEASAGGGGGGYTQKLINAPSGTYSYTVGAGGGGGNATYDGGAGGAGGFVITVYATSSANAAGNDYAEMFPVSNPIINAGDIVAVDSGIPVSMQLAVKGDNAPLAGVISTNPGQLLGDKEAVGQRPVALAGRVPVKFSYENGDVKIGDRIAPSSIPGVGMKAGPFDASVGIVIAPAEHGDNGDTVMIFLDLRQGIDVDVLSDALLASSQIAETAASATDATSTASTTPFHLNNFLKNLFAKITMWLADAANGIGDFFARVGNFGRVNTDELCMKKSDGSEICTTGDQLAAILQAPVLTGQATATSATAKTSLSTADLAMPQASPASIEIIITGNSPALLTVGDSYADLGVIASSSDQSLVNLGIRIFQIDDNGTEHEVTTPGIDTSQAGEHKIIYRVINADGTVLAEAARTVMVVGAVNDNAPASKATTTTTSKPAMSSEIEQEPDSAPTLDENASAIEAPANPVPDPDPEAEAVPLDEAA